MADEGVLFERGEVRKLFGDACRARIVLEIQLDQEHQSYGAYLLQPPPEDLPPDNDDVCLISPLEPAQGNIRIRRSRMVAVGFHLGERFYQGKTGFQQVVQREGAPALVLFMPKVVQYVARRRFPRLELPKDVGLRVMVEKRGGGSIYGELVDISEGGVSFLIPPEQNILEKDDRVSITLIGRNLDPMPMLSSICYQLQMRDINDFNTVRVKCGAQFLSLSSSAEMTLKRVVKTLLTRGEWRR